MRIGWLAICLLLIGTQGANALSEFAEPGELRLMISLFPGSVITSCEPLVARLDIINQSARPLKVPISNLAPDIRLEVYDSGGHMLMATPPHIMFVDGHVHFSWAYQSQPRELAPSFEIKPRIAVLWPGESISNWMVLNGTPQDCIRNPGDYIIKARPGILAHYASDSVSLHVLPKCGWRLKAACEAMFEPVFYGTAWASPVPGCVRMVSLYQVADGDALPYMQYGYRVFNDLFAVVGMVHINIPSSGSDTSRLINHLYNSDRKRWSSVMYYSNSFWAANWPAGAWDTRMIPRPFFYD